MLEKKKEIFEKELKEILNLQICINHIKEDGSFMMFSATDIKGITKTQLYFKIENDEKSFGGLCFDYKVENNKIIDGKQIKFLELKKKTIDLVFEKMKKLLAEIKMEKNNSKGGS